MPSSKTRQRKLARAKVERQMARRATRARRNRQLQAGIAVGVVALLAIVGTVWALGGFSSSKPTATAGTCAWNAADTTANANLKDVGEPPTSGEPRTGTETITIQLGQGTVTGTIDVAKAPCTAASMKFLAGKKFFDNTKCHRLTTSGLYVLQCGDPSGTGQGGPAYTFADENLPTVAPAGSASVGTTASPSGSASVGTTASPSGSASPSTTGSPSPNASTSGGGTYTYRRGTLAMANSGPDTNGSQFFIVYQDSPLPPNYIVFGTVTSGLDVVEKIAAGGAVDSSGAATGDGKPKTDVVIQTLTVTGADQSGSSPSPTPSPSTSPPAGSPSPSAKS